jgi:hypothetical protein
MNNNAHIPVAYLYALINETIRAFVAGILIGLGHYAL